MDGWNTSFLLGRPIFKGYVSLPEGKYTVKGMKYYLPSFLEMFAINWL